MERIGVSNRLMAIADFVPKGARLADVGSDHAYLPLFLVKQGQIDFAVAGEVVKGPYESALKNVTQEQALDRIQVRLADGLSAVDVADQIDTVTIAGMGGRLIADILATGKERLVGVNRLILQPNNREDDIRTWLANNDFRLVAETILEENGKIYEILVAEPGQMNLSAEERRFGPFLMKEVSPVFREKWERELDKLVYALAQIPAGHEDDRSAISQKIETIKEVLSC